MAGVALTSALRAEYQDLFDTCKVAENHEAEVGRIVGRIEANRSRYETVGVPLGIPWHVVAVIHNMEASLAFTTHLHNGDPLTARTVHVPKGRPPQGDPPFPWEVSAADALRFDEFDQWTDWTLPGTLYKLEGYNGWGYRRNHPAVFTPYLWSYSNHYTRGKYIADGKWSDTAVSQQCGAAVILRQMVEKGTIAFVAGDAGNG